MSKSLAEVDLEMAPFCSSVRFFTLIVHSMAELYTKTFVKSNQGCGPAETASMVPLCQAGDLDRAFVWFFMVLIVFGLLLASSC